MITVNELIMRLTEYEKQSPENGMAQVMLGSFGEVCYEFSGATDAREFTENRHYLIFVPAAGGNHIGIKQLRTS